MNPADRSRLDAIFFGAGFTLSAFGALLIFDSKQVGVFPFIIGTLLIAAAPMSSAWMYGWSREAYKNAQ